MTKPTGSSESSGRSRPLSDDELKSATGGRLITGVFSYGNFTMVITGSKTEGVTVATIIKE
jgi:hypothetical protein